MIVNHTEHGWEIIFQAAHALLAGQIAMALTRDEKVAYWPQTLAAIIDHDDLKESFGKNVYLTKLGAPKDFTEFTFNARERFTEAKRRIASGHHKHRWIGLLASRHVDELYSDELVSKSLAKLIRSERTRRAAVLEDLKMAEPLLEHAYRILQWCDRASLILCKRQVPAMNRRLEIAELKVGKTNMVWEQNDNTLSIDPWPFSAARVEVSVEARTLHKLTFPSDRELERCLQKSEIEVRHWQFERG